MAGDRTGSPLVLRRGNRAGGTSRKVFSTEEAREDVEGHRAECKLRFARSALNPYSVASTSSPASSVLKFFLNRGRHIVPRLSEATRIQATALVDCAEESLESAFAFDSPGNMCRP